MCLLEDSSVDEQKLLNEQWNAFIDKDKRYQAGLSHIRLWMEQIVNAEWSWYEI